VLLSELKDVLLVELTNVELLVSDATELDVEDAIKKLAISNFSSSVRSASGCVCANGLKPSIPPPS
jgi:hypothetical protein